VLVDGERVATDRALIFHDGLRRAGVGDGAHAFAIDLPERLCDGGCHSVVAVALANGAMLPAATDFLGTSPPGDPWYATNFLLGRDLPATALSDDPYALGSDANDPPVSRPTGPLGCLESVADGSALGWAYDPRSPRQRLAVEVLVDGEIVAETIADLPRASLADEGMGDGRHGFVVELPSHLCDEDAHVISLRLLTGERLPVGHAFTTTSSDASEWARTTFVGAHANVAPSPTATVHAAVATGPVATGPATGPVATGPATGPVATGPATGPVATGPATGPVATGPATGPVATGPVATGPATGPVATGPAPRLMRLRPCDELHLPRRSRSAGFGMHDGPETVVLTPEMVVEVPEPLHFAVQPRVKDPLTERRMRFDWERRYAVPPLVVSRLPNAIVDTDSFLISPTEHRYLRDSLRHPGALLHWGYALKGATVQREVSEIAERDERVVVLGAQTNRNYSHWMVESLARALVFQPLDDGTRHYLTPPLKDWQRETLDLIGLGSDRILELEPAGPVRFREVVAVSRGIGGMPALRPVAVTALAALAEPTSERRRIYCSRAGTRLRHVTNEAEVAELLARHGFESLRPETLPIREQIEMFATAEAVFGLHGSGLTNIAFSRPGTHVIELQPEEFNMGGIPWNWILASLRDQPFTQVVCRQADTLHELPQPSRDVTVDVGHLDELLYRVLPG
jgi:Glycosyltransferase 61